MGAERRREAEAEPSGEVILWGGKVNVVGQDVLALRERLWVLHHVEGARAIRTLCELLSFTVEDEVPVNLLDAVHRKIQQEELLPHYETMSVPVREADYCSETVFLTRIEPLSSELASRYPEKFHGLLVFVNDNEPGGGTIPMQDVMVKKGDCIKVVHIVEEPRANTTE